VIPDPTFSRLCVSSSAIGPPVRLDFGVSNLTHWFCGANGPCPSVFVQDPKTD
jgi:hypothetical protein